jgi:hypothetical protein
MGLVNAIKKRLAESSVPATQPNPKLVAPTRDVEMIDTTQKPAPLKLHQPMEEVK